MKNYLITGGAGFIGSSIAKALINRGDKCTIIDNLSTGIENNIPNESEFIKFECSLESEYSKLSDLKFDAVLHLAAQSSGEASFKDPLLDLNSHVKSTFFILQYCKKNKIDQFLYASSMAVYGQPNNFEVHEENKILPISYYGAAKAAAEILVQHHTRMGMKNNIIRMFNIYGPNQNLSNMMQGMISIYLSYVLNDKPIIVKGSEKRFRDFLFIDDAVDAWIRILDNKNSDNEIYNLGSGIRTEVKDILEIIRKNIAQSDYPISFQDGTPGDQFGIFANISKLSKDIDWNPKCNIELGIEKMLKYYNY